MKHGIACAVSIMAVSCLTAASASAAEGQTVVRTFGIGRMPCSVFLAKPENTFQGSVWALGYWTGLNIAGVKGSHTVGDHAQAEEIVADVKKACAAEPSTVLYGVIDNVYERFQKDGK